MPKKKRRPRKPARRHQPPPRPKPPSGSSLGGNVIAYALQQGIDVTDPAALDAFMAYYNALPHEARVAISDGAWLDDEDDLEDLLDDEDWLDDEELDAMFPDFLGELPDDETLEAHIATVDENAYYVDAPLMRRADVLLRHIGDGHPFTDEEGLGREATIALVEQFGYEADGIETTWDAPPVSGLIAGLAGGGFLEVSYGQVRPAALISPWAWPDAPPEQRTAAGRMLHATTLNAFLEESDEESAALAGPFTAMALMAACGPDGLHLPASAEDDEHEELRLNVRADLLALEDLGLVQRDGEVFTASPVLLTVLPAVLESVSGEELPE